MKKSSVSQRCLFVTLVSLACVSPLQASVNQASATLDRLTWRLIDLAPDDGVAPSVTFSGGNARYGHGSSSGTRFEDVPATPFPAASVSRRVDDGTEVTLTPEKIQITLDKGDLSHRIPADLKQDEKGGYSIWESEYVLLNSGGPFEADIPDLSFHLSPLTALVIEGEVRVRTFADASASVLSVQSQASVNVDLGRGQRSFTQSTSRSDWINGLSTGPDSDEEVSSFSLVYEAGEYQTGSLEIQVLTTLQATVVPEPSSYLMMGLGLGMLGCVRRHLKA